MLAVGEASGVEYIDNGEVTVLTNVTNWDISVSGLAYFFFEPISNFHESQDNVFESKSNPCERRELVVSSHYWVPNDRKVCDHRLQAKELKPFRRNFTLKNYDTGRFVLRFIVKEELIN